MLKLCAKTPSLVLFGCNTYLSVYQIKNRTIALLIRSQSRVQFGFTFCTCITRRLDVIDFFQLEIVKPSITNKLSINFKLNAFSFNRDNKTKFVHVMYSQQWVCPLFASISRYWLLIRNMTELYFFLLIKRKCI